MSPQITESSAHLCHSGKPLLHTEIEHQSMTKHRFLRILKILCYHDMWPTKMTWGAPRGISRSSVTSAHHIEACQSGWPSIEYRKFEKPNNFTIIISMQYFEPLLLPLLPGHRASMLHEKPKNRKYNDRLTKYKKVEKILCFFQILVYYIAFQFLFTYFCEYLNSEYLNYK
jgi:hypothetical protein